MANPMSYAGASVPAPNVSTTNDDLFFLALINHIFAQHNANDAILAAATSASNPTALFLRDANGGGTLANLAVVVPGSGLGLTALSLSAPTGYSGNFLSVLLNGVDKFHFDNLGQMLASAAATFAAGITISGGGGLNITGANGLVVGGNGSVGGTLGVGGASTIAGLLTLQGGLTVTAGGVTLPRGALSLGALFPFALSQSVTDGLGITVGAGDFVTATATAVTFASGTTTFVSTGAIQFIGVYVTDAGALTQTAAATTLAGVQFPTNAAKPLYVFRLPASATGVRLSTTDPGGTLGYIAWDARFSAGGSAAGLFSSLITDYKVVPSGAAGTVNVSPGPQYEDSTGTTVGPSGVQAASLPTQPSGTNIQYVLISHAPGATTPVVTGGPVGASPAKPAGIVGNVDLAMVTWRGATTLPSGVVAAADIVDMRFPIPLGGSGGSGAPSTLPFWLGGTSVSAPNALDATSAAPAAAAYFHPANLKTGTSNASVHDAIGEFVSASVLAGMTASGASVTLDASVGPLFVAHAGRYAVLNSGTLATTAITNGSATASGAAGVRYLIADLSAPPGFAIGIGGNGGVFPTLGTYQKVVATLVWDGTTLYLDRFGVMPADGSYVGGVIDGTQYAPNTFLQTAAGGSITANAGVYAIPFGLGKTVRFPVPMVGRLEFEFTFTQTATVQTANAWFFLDGATGIGKRCYCDGVPSGGKLTFHNAFEWDRTGPLAAGSHLLQPLFITQTGGAGGLGLTDLEFRGRFERA
jgi:hypothetical protein